MAAAEEAVGAVARAFARVGPLDQLRACRELSRRLERLERSYADHAARHYTWEEIGEALGISRQAAWKQYGPRS